MKHKNFLLIGDLPLATLVFRLIEKDPNAKVIAVLTEYKSKLFLNDPWDGVGCLFDEAMSKGCPIFHSQEDLMEEYSINEIDIGISCRASIIYKPKFINLFKDYFINMHGGLLPERSGLHIACHSIIQGDSKSGGTLHEIEETIDTGPIFARKEFSIDNIDTALTVYKKTQVVLYELLVQNLSNFIENKTQKISQSSFSSSNKYFTKKELQEFKEINIKKLTLSEIDLRVRGCDFPGHEPAWILVDDKKIYLTTTKFFENNKI